MLEESEINSRQKILEMENKLIEKEKKLDNREKKIGEIINVIQLRNLLKDKEHELKNREDLLNKTMNNNILPKVCEKKDPYIIGFIRKCISSISYGSPKDCEKAEILIKSIIDNSNEYIVSSRNAIITNLGKIFVQKIHCDRSYYYYCNINVKIMTIDIVRMIDLLSSDAFGCNGLYQGPLIQNMKIGIL